MGPGVGWPRLMPGARNPLGPALAAAALVSVLSGGPLLAGGPTAGIRLQSAVGHDNNVFEQLESENRIGDSFVRLQADGRLAWRRAAGRWRGELLGRALMESYAAEPAEDRRQGECSAALGVSDRRGARRLLLEGGISGRDYRSAPSRNHWRGWGRILSGISIGPRGTLVGRFDLWSLDFRRTGRRDRTGGAFDLSYEHPAGRELVLAGGLELGTTRHGVASIQLERGEIPGEPSRLLEGPDRLDQVRRVHLGVRRLGRLLLRAQYGYRSQSSNSIDGEYRRHEISWLLSAALPAGLHGQFYGNRGHTRFTHPALDDYFIPRVGEIEAGEDDNTVAVRISRGILGAWSADLRAAWHRNESLLVGDYYDKVVATAGISWESGNPSGF